MKTEILKIKGDYLLKKVWRQMHHRCEVPSDQRYPRYGGRGISVDKQWAEFEPFSRWAYENGYEKGLSIERIDNNGPYAPNNCRWASRKEQANNTSRNHVVEWRGEERTIAEWSELTGIQQGTIWKRLFLGWSAEQVFTTKVRGSSISWGGETKTLAEWSRETGLSEDTISRRLKRGWPVSQALTQKSQREVLR